MEVTLTIVPEHWARIEGRTSWVRAGGAEDVDLHLGAGLLHRDVFEGAVGAVADVVDQDVDAALLLEIVSTPACIEASSVTSIAMGWMPTRVSFCMRSARRPAAYTVNPAATSWRAVASPMPEEAPVTNATSMVVMVVLLVGVS
jgi:hypothetical protein